MKKITGLFNKARKEMLVLGDVPAPADNGRDFADHMERFVQVRTKQVENAGDYRQNAAPNSQVKSIFFKSQSQKKWSEIVNTAKEFVEKLDTDSLDPRLARFKEMLERDPEYYDTKKALIMKELLSETASNFTALNIVKKGGSLSKPR